jgi:endonuclease G, mitochondrial
MVTSNSFKDLVAATRDDRANVRRLVATGQWRRAEPDKLRLANFVGRSTSFNANKGAEALQGDTIDFQPVSFLPVGTRVQRAVGYVEVMAAGASTSGTGFLISPDLFITNRHVITDADVARGAQVVFDRQAGDSGRPLPTTTFLLDPDRFALFSGEEDLDYAIVALGERTAGAAEVTALGYCPLSNRRDKHRLGMAVNIIQHPEGAPKLIAVRNNLLTHRTDRTLLYETDTDHGSSGAPVFNDLWEVIALHHWGEPFLEQADDLGEPIPQAVNEGVRISAIYADLERRRDALSAGMRALVDVALSYDRQPPAATGDRTLGPPRPSIVIPAEVADGDSGVFGAGAGGDSSVGPRLGSESFTQGDSVMSSAANGGELKVVIPIEVTVRVGGSGHVAATAAGDTAPAPLPPAQLKAGAEKLKIDKDYSNRSGYNPRFIPGVVLDMPEPDAALKKQIAPLRAGEADAEKGVLDYEHFSVVLNKAKRIAMFTATNINGEDYLNVDRVIGRVKDGAEGETWYLDPRVSQTFYLDQSFYSAWSTYFDRGHLTRRMDPNWGTPEIAERANADTYHFPNCSPQHFRFNQSADFWQGAERYILEKGALANDSNAHLCVFQGPIFADAIDRYADDVQIPSSFFKVIIWKSDAGLKAVGLVVDQLALMDEKRTAIGQAGDDKPVKVNQWRVAIPSIEKRTGLDFSKAVRDADTIATAGQPSVGEAQILLGSLEDIKL